jgi:hypothetical protein
MEEDGGPHGVNPENQHGQLHRREKLQSNKNIYIFQPMDI